MRQGQRRQTDWGASADITGTTALAAASVILDQSFTDASLNFTQPGTIIRTRGELWVKSDQLVATEEPFGAMGMVVVEDRARVAGAASLPFPIADAGSDSWFVHQFFQAGIAVSSAIGILDPWSRYSFDSKAMRKIEDGQAIVIMLENAHATHGAVFLLHFRILFKLH